MGEADGPDRKPTTEIPKTEIMEGLLRKLSIAIDEGFARHDAHFEKVEADIGLLVTEGRATNERVARLEGWKDGVEERLRSNSERAKTFAEGQQAAQVVDGKHDAAIAQVHTKVDTIAATVSALAGTVGVLVSDVALIKKVVVGVFSDPRVRLAGKVLFGLIMAYAAAKNLKVLP